jgi:hypothetical protein
MAERFPLLLALALAAFYAAALGAVSAQGAVAASSRAAVPAPPDSVVAASDSVVPAPADSTTDRPAAGDPGLDPAAGATPGWDGAADYPRENADDYVGAPASRTYRQESEAYRSAPPLRYNRAEGLVIGLQREPLPLDGDDAARVYGQVGYATALRDVRYTVGLESALGAASEPRVKFGVAYRKQTLTPDRWKTSYLENSLGGLGFEYDFFDYYEAEGASIYAVQALPGSARLETGFRVEEHRALSKQTDWSVFETGNFRPNPRAGEGQRRALFGAFTAGRIRNANGLPSGRAVRLSASVGRGLGGDLPYNRYEADGRAFLPLSDVTRLGVRLRGGYATSDAPAQARFTLGGIGSTRSYAQNRFGGTRMLLANVEYMVDGAPLFDEVFDDLFLVGLFDAGWVGTAGEPLRTDDVLPSAGFGVGLDERKVRIDVSWPLRSVAGSRSGPSIWLRITPNF